MEVRVEDRVALITGGTRGIGMAVASGLLRSGAGGVVITSRKEENLESALQELSEVGPVEGLIARADDGEAADRAILAAIERFGSCDILVNNAGTNPAPGLLAEVDVGAVDKVWAVNQRGPLLHVQAAWRHWMADHGGAIVNIGSVGGSRPAPITGAYNVSKAALMYMTKQLAMEMAPTVRVNAVAPGVIRTRMSELLWKTDPDAVAALHPLNRLGEPQDVANVVVFLCSDQASWVTGVVVPVDGGLLVASSGVS